MKRSSSVLKTALLAAGLTWLGLEAARRLREDDLRGEVALITGGSRGLGFLLARELGHNGCRVAICARDRRELEAARADLAAQGIDIFPVVCDVANQGDVEQMISQVTRHYGHIDLLVNNAGIILVGPVENMTAADFHRVMDINFWGAFYPTFAVLPQMLARQRGRIVNITSIGGEISVPHLLPYSAAKFAATGFSQGLSAELRNKGIQVTTVAPSTMRTGSHLQAEFTGQQGKEFSWFSLSATLPGVAVSAESAARQIVQAIKQRATILNIGLPAKIGARMNGLFPGLVTDLLALVIANVMPTPTPQRVEPLRGMAVKEQLPPEQRARLEQATTLGQQAAQQYNQYTGENLDASVGEWA
ncbi:MAG: SDR family oxidoreductase [Caldilinea sp. CFX5]|nr:SDR family oxidoreductase [Caldilinea sp. CFX5]